MKPYRLAIFDLDGTLLDTLEDLKNSLNAALAAHGYPQRTLEEVRTFVGDGVRMLVTRGAPKEIDPAALEALLATFRAHYGAHSMDCTRPYEGVVSLLEALRRDGVKLAVVSNKADSAVRPLCDHFFPGLFDCAMGEIAGIAKKPAPDLVDRVRNELGISRDEAVYIGDSEVDVKTAQNAGLDALIVTWGFREAAFLKENGAKRLVDSADALYEAIQRRI